MVMVLALLVGSFILTLEGRDIKDKAEHPQNFIGFGGIFGTPVGFMPLIGTVPAIGGAAPIIPQRAEGDQKNAVKP